VPAPVSEFALYRLNQAGTTLSSVCCRPFDSAAYSRYKYGSANAADGYARELWLAFLARHGELAHLGRLLVAASPYHRVPTAANAVAVRFAAMLSAERAERGLPAARMVRIKRMAVPAGDYGQLPMTERTRLMAGNVLSFDRLRPCADGAHLIVVDDVKVTGEHQRCLRRASDSLSLGSRMFVHIAMIDGESTGELDPVIEDRLNHSAVKTLDDLAAIAASPDFTWNVRVCKFLLKPANRAGLGPFLAGMPDRFTEELCRNSVADGYARMDAYRESYQIAARALRRHES